MIDYEISEYVALNVETSGINPDKDEILRITAAKKTFGGGFSDDFDTWVKPQKENYALDLKTALEKFSAFAGGLPIVAHNAEYDVSFLTKAYRKALKKKFANESRCTLVMAKELAKADGKYKLSGYKFRNVAQKYYKADYETAGGGLENEAAAQVMATAYIFETLKNKLDEHYEKLAPKVLFLTKEQSGGRDNIARWAYGIKEYAKSGKIAPWTKIAEIEKRGGFTAKQLASMRVANDFGQIAVYKPDVIICCGLKNLNALFGKQWKSTSRQIAFTEYNAAKVIDFINPKVKTNSAIYYYALMDAVSEILKKVKTKK